MTDTRSQHLSIFLIGDSIDRNAVSEICRAKATDTTTYIPEAVITKAMGMSGYWMCKFRAGTSYTIANLMNYGVSKEGDHYLALNVHCCNYVHHMPVQECTLLLAHECVLALAGPYWKYAYADADSPSPSLAPQGLHMPSPAHITKDAVKIRRMVGAHEPTIIIMQSYLWDIAPMARNGLSEVDNPARFNTSLWVYMALEQVKLVRKVFPSTRILWRTVPEHNRRYSENHVSGDKIQAMNKAIHLAASTVNLEVVDFDAMVRAAWKQWQSEQSTNNSSNDQLLQKMPPFYSDMLHPGPALSIAYMEMAMQIARDTSPVTLEFNNRYFYT